MQALKGRKEGRKTDEGSEAGDTELREGRKGWKRTRQQRGGRQERHHKTTSEKTLFP